MLNLTLPPLPDSKYAKEGTRAHALCEAALSASEWNASAFVGRPVPDFAEDTTPVDKPMADAVQVYLDTVRLALKEAGKGAQLFVEQRFTLPELGVDPGTGKAPHGTNDACVYSPVTNKLTVIDYKHGAGRYVETVDNTQLLFYAAGAVGFLKRAGAHVSAVTICIVQPRVHGGEPVRSVEIAASDVYDWLQELAEGAERARAPNAPLVPGAHCKGTWCPAAHQDKCPAFRAKAVKSATDDFGQIVDTADVPRMDLDELGARLAEADLLADYLACLRDHAKREAQAGRMPKGFKWIRGRGSRTWNAPDNVVLQKLSRLTNQSDFKTVKIFSVAQAEEVFGRAKFKKLTSDGELAGLCATVAGKPVLVHESHKSPSIQLEATEDFEPVEFE
jgi:hypothetical protein